MLTLMWLEAVPGESRERTGRRSLKGIIGIIRILVIPLKGIGPYKALKGLMRPLRAL